MARHQRIALLHRRKDDGIDITHAPDADVLSECTSRFPTHRSREFVRPHAAQALVALGRTDEVERAAVDYMEHPDADAFEVGTLGNSRGLAPRPTRHQARPSFLCCAPGSAVKRIV